MSLPNRLSCLMENEWNPRVVDHNLCIFHFVLYFFGIPIKNQYIYNATDIAVSDSDNFFLLPTSKIVLLVFCLLEKPQNLSFRKYQ